MKKVIATLDNENRLIPEKTNASEDAKRIATIIKQNLNTDGAVQIKTAKITEKPAPVYHETLLALNNPDSKVVDSIRIKIYTPEVYDELKKQVANACQEFDNEFICDYDAKVKDLVNEDEALKLYENLCRFQEKLNKISVKE